jgi:hypothetical protein
MERKWLIAIALIAIVVVGFSGWYLLYGTQKPKPVVSADIAIDSKDYTVPIIWNLTAVSGGTNQESHTIINMGTNTTGMTFNTTIWHLAGNQWTKVGNSTKWFNGTTWISASQAAVQPSIFVIQNTTAGPWTAFANKSGESSTYFYSLTYNDKTIYFNLRYAGSNPTVDGQTVFAYVAFDVNGNGTLNPSDKAFNFTSNPSLPKENELEIYTPANSSSWNTTPANYSWNGMQWNGTNDVPITVLCTNNRTDITLAFPFSYIGATIGGHLGFVLQAFSHDWVTFHGKAPTLSNYIPVPRGLFFPPVASFSVEPNAAQTFYIEAAFTSAASGEYSIVFEFQATVQNAS